MQLHSPKFVFEHDWHTLYCQRVEEIIQSAINATLQHLLIGMEDVVSIAFLLALNHMKMS